MSITTRAYIFAEDGALKRVPRRVVEALVAGRDALPEFAGTKQRVATVVIENEGSKPIQILDVQGTFWTFDDAGQIQAALFSSFSEWMETFDYGRAPDRSAGTVVSLVPEIKKRDVRARHRWSISADELDRIAADMWPGINGAAVDVAVVKGVKPKKPPLTFEAKQALREIGPLVSSIDCQLQSLSEPSLKGLAFEARRTATYGEEAAIWEGVASTCERHREIKARRRSGKGVWSAVAEAWRWEDYERQASGSYPLAYERCDGKQAAIDAARLMIKKYADHFSEEGWVEVVVKSDIEWQPEDA